MRRKNQKPGARGEGRNFSRSRGAAQIEFILTILTILFLIFATWEIVMIVYTMNVLSDAAKEGVRCAIVRGTWDPTLEKCIPSSPSADPPVTPNVTEAVRWYARASLHDISGINITVCYPTSQSTCAGVTGGGPLDPGSRVRVEVSYTFVPYTALPFSPTLRAASEGRMVF